MTRAGRETKRRRQAKTAQMDRSAAFIDILKRRLAGGGQPDAPWSENDEQRYQKQFGRPSPLAAKTLGDR